jgi:adenine deaminase
VDGEKILAILPIPIGGIMSDQPIEFVHRKMDPLLQAANEQGSALPDSFMILSYPTLPVIPSLKITDHGLIDIEKFEVIPLFVN